MWQGYERRASGYQKRELEPYVSINRRGEIVLNRSALELIDGAINVILFYDAETKRIGIRSAYRADYSLKVFCARHYGRGGRSRVVRAGRFLKQYGIVITETKVFRDLKAEAYQMLVLDLNAAL